MTDPLPSPTCPDCGAPLAPDSPQALCPACLMRQALASRTIPHDGEKLPHLPPPSPEEIADKFPGYEILECLGRGGMGVVYKARQKSLNRLVAIKILAPERVGEGSFAQRFTIEAELLAKLSHPHIVTIHDFGETSGLFYLVMEFIDGVNLRDLLRDGKLEPAQALAIVPPICDALQYAHDKGIVHRDIKPENLLLDRDGRIKIADFGIAALMGTDGDPSGTPPYMAPEQCGASPEVDNRADIYALGVVLYEMLTGERPHKELIAPSKKVHIDVRLDEIVLRALEKTPELRYQTAGIFKTQVETIVSAMALAVSQNPEQPTPASAPAEPRPVNRTALAVGFGIMMLCIIGYQVVLNHLKQGDKAVGNAVGSLVEDPTTSVSVKLSSSFGPVVERELRVGEETLVQGLDFESGKVLTLSLEEFNRKADDGTERVPNRSFGDWVEAKGMDMFAAAGDKGFGLGGSITEFKLSALPVAAWDTATEPELKEALEHAAMEHDKFSNGLLIPTDAALPLTYALRSGDKLGLLQITARVQNPKGIKLRYKLVQRAIIDQVVPNVYGRGLEGVKCFDFESNRFHTPPEALADELLSAVNRAQTPPPVPWHRVSPALIGWLDQTGVDVVAASYDSGAELLSLGPGRAGTVVIPLKPFLAEIDPSQAPFGPANLSFPENALTLERIAYLGWPRKPGSEFYGFQTREGNRGDLQITGITDDRFRDVKIRYKWVQNEDSLKPAPQPQYELSIQFGHKPNDPIVKKDVELGKPFNDFKNAGDRLFSISGQIDEPKNGKFPGNITLGDWNVSEAHKGTGHQGTIPVELELGKPFNHTVVVGIGFIRIITLNEKTASSEPIADPAATDTSEVDGARGEHFEPMKELEIPLQDFPEGGGREGYRLTVAPDAGGYVLATLREYEGTEVIGEKTPVKRQVARLLRTQSASHSEDIFLDVYGDDMKTRIAAGSRYGVSGFGQQVVVTGLGFAGGSGNSVGDEKQPRFVTRRFKFIDSGGDEARTRIVEFELRMISENDTAALAKRHGFSLPDENVANWAITLADPPAEPATSETDAGDGSWGDHFKHGDIRRAQNGLEDALASYLRSLAVAKIEMMQRPQDAAWQAYGQRRIKKSHTRIGDVLCAQGDLVGALENYRAARASFEPLVRKDPADEEQRHELTALYVKIGDVLQAQGDKAGALASFRKAQQVDFPDFRTWEDEFVDSIGGSYNPTIPFKPEELRQLAANLKSEIDFRRLARLINRAGAEKDASFRDLLDNPELRKDEEVNLALIAYDYSVNGNTKALDELLARLAKEKNGSDSSVAATLAFVDEWDRVPKAMEAHFVGADGSGADLKGFCEAWSAYLFPRNSLKHEGKAGEGVPVKLRDKR